MKVKKLSATLALLAAITVAVPGWSQTITLTGHVMNPVMNMGVVGADVTVSRANKKPITVVSGDGGSYAVPGLKPGDLVTLECRRNRYLPNPCRVPEFELTLAELTKDLYLYDNTVGKDYWAAWAGILKDNLAASIRDPEQRIKRAEQRWGDLASYGFSAEARGQAARQLMAAFPEGQKSHILSTYGLVDPAELALIENSVFDAINGKSTGTSITDPALGAVAGDIAASALAKVPAGSQQKLLQAFFRSWKGSLVVPENVEAAIEGYGIARRGVNASIADPLRQ